MTSSNKTISIVSFFTLACMSGWVSAANVNSSLNLNQKIQSSQQLSSANYQVNGEVNSANQLEAEGNAEVEMPEENSEMDTVGSSVVDADSSNQQEAPETALEAEESMDDDAAELANVTSGLSSTLDANVSLVAETLSQADMGNTLKQTFTQTLDLNAATDSVAQASQITEQLADLTVQDTISASTQTLLQQDVNGQVTNSVSEQVTSAVQAETATQVAQSIVANIGL